MSFFFFILKWRYILLRNKILFNLEGYPSVFWTSSLKSLQLFEYLSLLSSWGAVHAHSDIRISRSWQVDKGRYSSPWVNLRGFLRPLEDHEVCFCSREGGMLGRLAQTCVTTVGRTERMVFFFFFFPQTNGDAKGLFAELCFLAL